MSTFSTMSIVRRSISPKSQALPYKVRQVSWGALSVHTVRLYVTDVSGATVGIEREGLQAICPGSRFEKGWQGWWHVQENGKYLVEKRGI